MPQHIKDMIVNTVQVFNIYNKNNLQHFSIFNNISILIFKVCVSVNALPESLYFSKKKSIFLNTNIFFFFF